MKNLKEIIQEKLKIDQDVKETDMSKVTINIPKKDDYDTYFTTSPIENGQCEYYMKAL